MMAGTDRHSFLIENRTHVVGMNMLKHKGNNADFFPRGAMILSPSMLDKADVA